MRLKNIEVEVTGIYSYEAPAYGYGYERKYIYTMKGTDGTVYAWKNTTALLGYDEIVSDDADDYYNINTKGQKVRFNGINKGDIITISATVKGEDEYKGEKQTIVNRVKVHGIIFKGKTYEEIKAEKEAEKEQKKQEQQDSIKGEDFIWRMPYRQYKEHYSDCETVIDSYECRNGYKTIEVIIREGRLKASGVRGRRFYSYLIRFVYNGKKCCETFRAVCEENALRQLNKEFKGATDITLEEII